jgi:membrane associated rhomboid family serine protease
MVPAAVGFQCPSCVKEGASTVRAAKGAYGGLRVTNPGLVTWVLIGINLAVWLSIAADGGSSSGILAKLALTPDFTVQVIGDDSAAFVPGVAFGSWWQIFTSFFTHVEVWHIATNMLALYFVGPALEQALGRVRFVLLYVVSGIVGSAGVMLFSDPHGMTLGASGAIFGILGAMAVVAHKVGGDVRGILMWIGLNLVITFTIPNISWQGHLGGLVGGILVALAIVYAPRPRRAWIQFGTAALIVAVSFGLIAIKAHDLAQSQIHDVYNQSSQR